MLQREDTDDGRRIFYLDDDGNKVSICTWTNETPNNFNQINHWMKIVEDAGIEKMSREFWAAHAKCPRDSRGFLADGPERKAVIKMSNAIEKLRNRTEKEVWGSVGH